MKTILSKRVYQELDQTDGFCVLVDRLWPRGVRKESLRYDLWAKNIAPSTELRRWYHDDIEGHWEEFERRYLEELSNSSEVTEFIEQITPYQLVTLIYAAKDPMHNHALVLKEYLENSFDPKI